MTSRLLLIFVFLITYTCSTAQVQVNYNSSNKITDIGIFKKRYEFKLHQVVKPTKETIQLKELENEKSADKQFLIAIPIASSINVVSSSAWINDSLYSFGKFTVQADSAKTLSINFDDFFLPQTAELFIYNRDGLMIMGPITSSENNKNKIWGSSIFKGDILNIEVKVNTQELSQLKLNIIVVRDKSLK